MILTGEILSIGKETCHSDLLSITNLTWTDLGSKTKFRGEMPETDRLSHGTVNTQLGLHYILRSSPYRAVNTVSVIKTSQLMLYREIIAVCSQIHTKHINTLCG